LWNFCDSPILKGMSQRDPWGNAVTCAQAADATDDPGKRALLVYLGEFWLELAQHDTSEISESTAIDIAVVEKVQAEILGLTTTH
jgi:hypothetical protein